MHKVGGGRFFLVVVISLLLLNYSSANAASSSDKVKKKHKEEKSLIQVEKIAPGAVKSLENRSYDEAITIKNIEISGNRLIKSDQIMKSIPLSNGSHFDRDEVQKGLKSIYDMGYFSEKIKAVPETSPTGITLKIQVEENVPVTGINISGNTVVSSEELNSLFKDQYGLPQNLTELNRSVQSIEDLYKSKGYELARVKKISDDPDGMINIEVNEGIIDKVAFTGNKKTKDYVIKRNIMTTAGSVYNDKTVTQDLSRLMASKSFSDVRRVISASEENPDKYNLTIEVDEKRTGSISLGGGVDTGTGLFGSIGYVNTNLAGRGQELSLTSTVGGGVAFNESDVIKRANFQFEAKFTEPRLNQSLNSLELSAFGRDYASYQVPLAIERRIGGSVELARPIKRIPNLAGSFNFGTEYVKMREGDRGKIEELYASKGLDIAQRANQLESGTYISFGPSLFYDTRNRLLNTTDGWLVSAGLSENIAISGDAGTYTRGEIGIRRFFPIGKKSTFTIGSKVGAKIVGDMPEFASFRLGGSSTVRGFREGDVGNGSAYMLASAEYRTPIPFVEKFTDINFFKDMRLAGFIDAGSLMRETITDQIYSRPGYGISAGGGLRINIPVMGSIKVDYAYPLTSLGAGVKKKARFNFGFGDRY